MAHPPPQHKPQASLIPLDPSSASEREILRQQRVICGWKDLLIPKMCDQMRDGKRVLFWIGLPATEDVYVSADGRELVGKADEKEKGAEGMRSPLLETRELGGLEAPMLNASRFSSMDGGGAGTANGAASTKADGAASNGTSSHGEKDGDGKGLLPVGHISVDAGDFDDPPSDILFPPNSRTLSLTTLFVLPCYRKYGLGSWAMREAERLIREGCVLCPSTSSPSPHSPSSPSSNPPGSSNSSDPSGSLTEEMHTCKTITLSTLSARHKYEDSPEGLGIWARAGMPEGHQTVVYQGPWYAALGYRKYHEMRKWQLDKRTGPPVWWGEFWRKEL